MLKKHKTALLVTLLLPVQWIFIQFLKTKPHWVETYYSLGVYQYTSNVSRYLFGRIPFSMGDFFYLGMGLLALRWVYKNIKNSIKNPLGFILPITTTLSIVYFMFHILWGFNYYRVPIHKKMEMSNQYTTGQLVKITEQLIEKSNTLHRQLGYADSVKIDLPFTQEEILKKNQISFNEVSKTYPFLTHEPASLKKSNWSLGLTYMGYSGYLNPFSNEAHINSYIKTYKFPVVSAHETAHQIGYAAENEANFIATLATIHNPDTYIQYSGYIFALRYCINEIARRDIDIYHKTLPKVNTGILKSYKEMREFWASYENPFEVFSKYFYNGFLKANNQAGGIESYSYMVALVVNYFEKDPVE